MEKRQEVKKRTDSFSWQATYNPNGKDGGSAEYITKLTSLRNQLANQEKIFFDQALNRLGQTSLPTNYRSSQLRMSGSDVNTSQIEPTKSTMLDMVNKFRVLRHQQQNQSHGGILPLVGKQILLRKYWRETSVDREGVIDLDYKSKNSEENSSLPNLLLKTEKILQNDFLKFTQMTSRFPILGIKQMKASNALDSHTERPGIMKQLSKEQNNLSSFNSNVSSTTSEFGPTTFNKNEGCSYLQCSDSVRDKHATSTKERNLQIHPNEIDMDKLDTIHFSRYIKSSKQLVNEVRRKDLNRKQGRGAYRMTKEPCISHPISYRQITFEENETSEKKTINDTDNFYRMLNARKQSSNVLTNQEAGYLKYLRKQAGLSPERPAEAAKSDNFCDHNDDSNDENNDLIVKSISKSKQPQNVRPTVFFHSKDRIKTPGSSNIFCKNDKSDKNYTTDYHGCFTRKLSESSGLDTADNNDNDDNIGKRHQKIHIVIEMPKATLSSASTDADLGYVDDFDDSDSVEDQTQNGVVE